MLMNSQRRFRKSKGSALTEMGPALFILLMMIFFPLMDIIGMAAIYGACVELNFQQSKEASVVNSKDAMSPTGQVQKGVVDAWLTMGFGRFTKLEGYPKTNITYRSGTTNTNTNIVDKIVTVSTTCKCTPFLHLPWFSKVPGINAPMDFTITSEAPMENPDDAG